MATRHPRKNRTTRLGLRVALAQKAISHREKVEVQKAVPDFGPEGAGLVAKQALLDQRVFVVSGSTYLTMLDLLALPEQDNPGLADLFSRPTPWPSK